MKESFKEFWSSYWELQKHSNEWLKEHWKGYIILSVVIFIPVFCMIWLPSYIENKKLEKQIEELKENK